MKKISGPQFAKRATMPTRNMRGFSLLEMMIVVCIGLIMAAITFISLQPALKEGHINNAYDTALTQMRVARERAIAERSRYIVCFGANTPPLAGAGVPAPDLQSIQLWHWGVGVPASPPPNLISSVEIPLDVQFQAVAGLPAAAPDNWGAGGVAIDFDQGVAGGKKYYVMFMPDGSSQDELGNYSSGVLYMARAGTLSSSRAITIFGTTGRVRGWRLNAGAWIEQ
jgi:prepilin-type N-terminal cleavage/methylation domain-containing protein